MQQLTTPRPVTAGRASSGRAATSGWIEFWDTKHSIYVSPQHEAAHFRRIAEDIWLARSSKRLNARRIPEIASGARSKRLVNVNVWPVVSAGVVTML